jgi:hypothetical protein
VVIKQGTLFMDELVEPDGMDFYIVNNNLRNGKFFDNTSLTGLGIYKPSFPSNSTSIGEFIDAKA